ncbi:MAG: biotin/lipoyl-binding protein [Fibromonadales bacterium]|nr:biotin/lipoyl-binding protein [Fibromonadales bacterium]
MKTLRITLEGRTYDVGVEVLGDVITTVAPVSAPAPAPAAAPVPVAAPAPVPAPAPVAAGGTTVSSPMAGQVMKIKVAVGAAVSANQELIVLEAMKMETPIFAPAAGAIKSIDVKEGDAVEEGTVLLTIG